MDRNSDMFQMIKKINNFRNSINIWNLPQVQRYADDIFYAFTRGNVFAAFTNVDYNFSRSITYHPYPNGTRLCNIFDDNDQINVNNNQFNISMGAGNFKIYRICGNSKNLKSEIFNKIHSFLSKLLHFIN